MCLAIVLHRAHPDWPLVVAANRDELLARPSVTMTVLQEAGPRIHGGKDLLAGGTWLATNEHGVVAGADQPPGARRPGAGRRQALARRAAAGAGAARHRRGGGPGLRRRAPPARLQPGLALVRRPRRALLPRHERRR
ncbi:MAG: NRDE family protein [Myxococcota bacterium]